MRELQWLFAGGGIELRLGEFAGDSAPILRFAVGREQRAGDGPLFLGRSKDPLLRLPGAIVPLVDVEGQIVDRAVVLRDESLRPQSMDAKLVLPPGHPRILNVESSGAEVLPALWIQGANEQDLERMRARGRLLHALAVREDETVVGTGSDLAPLTMAFYLRRLPRIVLRDHQLVADNTDGALSMGTLLEEFVHRFSEDGGVLPHIRVATGYLYHHGLQRVLGLLEHKGVQSLHVLFSGRTDVRTAQALTTQFAEQIVPGLEEDAEGRLWALYRDGLESGRLQVRVYTDAFLHAKLFLGWSGRDKFGRLLESYAVVGSSNLSSGGLTHGGNLELDVTLQEPERNTRLLEWYDARWEEAALPVPALLQVIEQHRPQDPPVFRTKGLLEVWRAGAASRLVSHERHLALLGKLYADRLQRVRLPDETAFPEMERDIHPSSEQGEGVLALAERLLHARIAFLADSVGLGKTITALGTAWYLHRHGQARRVVFIAPRKLFTQWTSDAKGIGCPRDLLYLVNRHDLERMNEMVSRSALGEADLLIVDEAHEALRNRSNKLWLHLRAHLASHPECRVLLVSATPWNNRREDIYNYLLLAWNEARALRDRYQALESPTLRPHLDLFAIGAGGSLTTGNAVRKFESLPSEAWRRLFDEVFVQRTRSALQRRYGLAPEYPEREVHAHATPASNAHDALFASLEEALSELCIPYQEPFRTILHSAAATSDPDGDGVEPSNLRRSLLIQLFKRAESSEYALAVSLASIERRLVGFQEELERLSKSRRPRADLKEWLDARFGLIEEERRSFFDDDEGDPEEQAGQELTAQEKARFEAVNALCDRLDDAGARRTLRHALETQVDPDLERIRALRARLTFDLDERSPKALLLAGLVRDALAHKPILVAGFADTAIRMFVRIISLFPDKRIGLALGGDEAWLYLPAKHRPKELDAVEWSESLGREPAERRAWLLREAGRAQETERAALLDAFSPRARNTKPELLLRHGGGVDLLVGSEAISVGHNLQDSTCLVQLDLPWNPMVIEQRIGRIDRRGGGRLEQGRKIVDVHYCWSSAAIEQAVALRARLKEKARQAIADTRFDELLLLDLFEEVQRARRERRSDDLDAPVSSFLHKRQQQLAQSRLEVGGITPGTGSNIDGLRRLARWLEEERPEDPAEGVVAAASCGGGLTSPRWLLTLELVPEDDRGQPISGGRQFFQLPCEAESTAQDLAPDIEAVVSALLGASPSSSRSGLSRASWATELLHLDELLESFRAGWLKKHNEEVDERIRQRQSIAASREPAARLKDALAGTRSALEEELKRISSTREGIDLVSGQKDRLKYLLQVALDPNQLVRLIAFENEEELLRHLAAARAMPHAFFDKDFEAHFETLCGRAYSAHREDRSPQAEQIDLGLSPVDGRWGGLLVSVLGATFTGAPTPGGA